MPVIFENMKDAEIHLEIRNTCLEKYKQTKPREFLQLDHFGKRGGWSLGKTWELMQGQPVRVLINGDVPDRRRIAEMLQDLARWFEADESMDAAIRGLGDPTNPVFDDDDIPF